MLQSKPKALPDRGGIPGDATFLLTRIEDIDRFRRESRAATRDAVARHDALLRAVIARNGGDVFDSTEEGLRAVFMWPEGVLQAALASQRALQRAAGTGPVRLSVAMVLATTELEESGDGYAGGQVEQATRLLAAAHGGQILATPRCAERLRRHLPHGSRLLDLGMPRLPGQGRPEQVFQLVVDYLPTDFPPLDSPER